MPLSDIAVRSAKPKDRLYKLADQRGLYLLVNKTGKYFRFDYRFGGKRKTLSLGVYPDVKLKRAREKHGDARKLLENDIDPLQYKKAGMRFLSRLPTVLKPWPGNSLLKINMHGQKGIPVPLTAD